MTPKDYAEQLGSLAIAVHQLQDRETGEANTGVLNHLGQIHHAVVTRIGMQINDESVYRDPLLNFYKQCNIAEGVGNREAWMMDSAVSRYLFLLGCQSIQVPGPVVETAKKEFLDFLEKAAPDYVFTGTARNAKATCEHFIEVAKILGDRLNVSHPVFLIIRRAKRVCGIRS